MKGIFQNKVNDKRLETSGKKDQNGKKKKRVIQQITFFGGF